jgi:general stress protein YciG
MMGRDMRELGRRGGLATSRTHNHEHYVALGKKGFGRLAQKYTSRSFALKILSKKGKVAPNRPHPADIGPSDLRQLAADVGMEGYADNLPF